MFSKSSNNSQSALATMVVGLQAARTKLGSIIEQRFSAYANQQLLWDSRADYLPSKVLETDPTAIEFSKRLLSTLHNLEKILSKLNENKSKGEFGKPYLPYDLYQVIKIVAGDLLDNLEALASLTQKADLPNELSALFPIFTKIHAGTMAPEDLLSLGSVLPDLGKDFSILLENYFSHQRPALVSGPEQAYQTIATTAEVSVGLQAQNEWALLIEPGRDLIRMTQGLTELALQVVDENQKQLITTTFKALKNAKIDQNGYYDYSVQDSALSQSLKALANLGYAINDICNAPKAGFLGKYLAIVESAYKALTHFNNIQWQGIGEDTRVMTKQVVDGLLLGLKSSMLPHLDKLAKQLTQLESNNHLRQGAFSDELRSVFGKVESLYISRGLAIDNPFVSSSESSLEMQPKLENESAEMNALSRLLKQYLLRGEIIKGNLKSVAGKSVSMGVSRSPLMGLIPYLHEATYLSYVVPGLSKVTDPVYGAIDYIAKQVTAGTLSLSEGIKRSLSGFPRLELIQRLEHFFKSEKWDLDTRSAIRDFQERIIAELSQDERYELVTLLNNPEKRIFPEYYPGLIARINEATRKEKAKSEKGLLQKLGTKVQAAFTTTFETWPPQELSLVREKASEKNKALAEQNYKLYENKEAQEESKKLKLEHALNTLEQEGLSGLINATQAGSIAPEINATHKNKLAVLLADMMNGKREVYLSAAHSITTDFVNDSLKIKAIVDFVGSSFLGQRGQELRRSLTIELQMSGHLSPDDLSYDFSTPIDPDKHSALLNRIEAGRIVALRAQAVDGNQVAIKQLALINSYLTGDISLQLKSNEEWVKSIVEHYSALISKGRTQQAQTLGFVLARVSRVDAAIAKLVFSLPEAKQALATTCLSNESTYALYHEAQVKSFELASSADTYLDFIENNQVVISTLHEIVDHEALTSVDECYGNHPLKLAELIERFIKTKLTAGSGAESQMCEYFTALALLDDKSGAEIREKIIQNQLEAHGSVRAQYHELIANDKSSLFWEKVKSDFIENSQENVLIKSTLSANKVSKVLGIAAAYISPEYKRAIVSAITSYLQEQVVEVNKISDGLERSVGNRSPLGCRYAFQEANLLSEKAAQYFNQLSDKILMDLAISINNKVKAQVKNFMAKITEQIHVVSPDFHKTLLDEIGQYESGVMMGIHWDPQSDNIDETVQSMLSQQNDQQIDFAAKCSAWMASVNSEALRVLEENKRQYKEKQIKFAEDIDTLQELIVTKVASLTKTQGGALFLVALHKNTALLLKQYNETFALFEAAINLDQATVYQAKLVQLKDVKAKVADLVEVLATQGADQLDEIIKQKLAEYNLAAAEVKKSTQYKKQHLDTISMINTISEYFYYGTLIGNSIIKSVQAFISSIPPALTLLGKILPPIIYAADALVISLSLIYSAGTSIYLSMVEKKIGAKLRSDQYKSDFMVRTLGNTSALFLQVCAVLVFSGVLASTPVGWALIAGVAAIRWVTDLVVSNRQAKSDWEKSNNKLSDLNRKISALEELRDKALSHDDVLKYNDKLQELGETKKQLMQKVVKDEIKYRSKNDDLVWGFVGVVGSALFAAAVFFPPLGLLGLALIGISVGRAVLKAGIEYLTATPIKKDAPVEKEGSLGNNTAAIENTLRNTEAPRLLAVTKVLPSSELASEVAVSSQEDQHETSHLIANPASAFSNKGTLSCRAEVLSYEGRDNSFVPAALVM